MHFRPSERFWNKAGNGRFSYYLPLPYRICRWFTTAPPASWRKSIRRVLSFPNHDVLLIIDSILDFDDEESAKGWYCGGGADDLNMVICRSRSKTEHEDLFGIDYFHRGGHGESSDIIGGNRLMLIESGQRTIRWTISNMNLTLVWWTVIIKHINGARMQFI